jgi:hypothetical protein
VTLVFLIFFYLREKGQDYGIQFLVNIVESLCSNINGLIEENFECLCPFQSSAGAQEISSYMQEVTKELTAEIKSEIREVISQVQDVLDDSEMSDSVSVCESRPRTSSLSLKSAEDVADYIVEASHRLASEMKSELREVVSAVDNLIADDADSSRNSISPTLSAVSRSNAYLSSPEFNRRTFRPRVNSFNSLLRKSDTLSPTYTG